MNQEQPVWYTVDPVRDRAWWLRTAGYAAALLAQDGGGFPTAGSSLLWWVSSVVFCGFAVFWRDRYPWVLAVVALLLTASLSQMPIALGMVAVAGRARLGAALGYAAAGIGSLLLAWPRPFTVGVTTTGVDPTGGAAERVLVVMLLVVVPFLIGMLRRATRQATQARLAVEAEQRDLAAARGAADERTRIAQEMHDVLGHKLSLITMQAGALSVTADAGVDAVERQSELIRVTARQALDELRGILGVLGTEPDPLHPTPGLVEVRDLLAHAQASGLPLEVTDDLGDDQLPTHVGAALHRMVSEALTNVQRHAPNAGARVALRRTPVPSVVLEVSNDAPPRGRAATTTGPGYPGGRGLPGLRVRVQAVGGRFHAGPTPDGGWRLVAEIPIPEPGANHD